MCHTLWGHGFAFWLGQVLEQVVLVGGVTVNSAHTVWQLPLQHACTAPPTLSLSSHFTCILLPFSGLLLLRVLDGAFLPILPPPAYRLLTDMPAPLPGRVLERDRWRTDHARFASYGHALEHALFRTHTICARAPATTAFLIFVHFYTHCTLLSVAACTCARLAAAHLSPHVPFSVIFQEDWMDRW